MIDHQYAALPRPSAGMVHHYGPRVHLLSHPYAMTLLARLSSDKTTQPMVNHLTSALYDWMLAQVSSDVLRTRQVSIDSRMKQFHAEGVYAGECVDPGQRVVVVDIARAGTLPAYRIFHGLHHMVDHQNIRQDHITASRASDATGKVIGVNLETSKVGGPVAGATVLIPDPMAATGASVAAVVRSYEDDPAGPPARVAVMHLIVTPEYLARMTEEFPEMDIYAIRLDRGLSPEDVLQTTPGERWAEERGLNDISYIVPGAGGVGEVLNNSWI